MLLNKMRGFGYGLFLVALSAAAQDVRQQQKEMALGERLASELRQKTTRVDNAAVQAFVDRVGGQLAGQVPDRGWRYSFTVIAEEPEGTAHEVIGYPGGHIFIPAPLVLAAQDEAEFAGMLGRAMVRSAGPLVSGVASIPVFWNGDTLSQHLPFAFEQQEKGGGARVVQVLSAAGYDPQALVRYLERVAPNSPRIAELEAAIQQLPPKNYTAVEGDLGVAQDELHRLFPPRRPPSLFH